ncbi:MAG: hypothetical protein DRP50_08190 [Thermotoga sp.]|nr:MAG: hypothetical protein DRP50_08190 [Thermotoga sp.]
MGPRIEKLVFTMGFLIFLLGIVVLPFLDPSSGEFVVDIMAICISCIFLLVLTWYIRREMHMISRESDDTKQD